MIERTILELQALMNAGGLTAEELTNSYLKRIETIDREGPGLNSVIEINPDALISAAALDLEREKTGARGPLHGIPILLKDNIDTGDQMQTTAGSLALEGHHAAEDAFIVRRLRTAGAVILGKTNLSEWANFRSPRSSSGWSSRGGQTRNPYALDRNPCGSSAGSGAAVAANLCAAAVGTETDGSIICPSAVNGIVGLKPTLGLVSRSGIIPIAHSQDTAGPMARTVTDAALLLSALAGLDPADPAALDSRGQRDYTLFLLPDGLQGTRIGIARNFFGAFDERDQIMEAAIETLAALGAIMVENTNITTLHQFAATEFEVLLYEFKHDLNLYLGAMGPDAQVHSLEELIHFNETHRSRIMPFFGQELLIKAQAKGPLSETAYLESLATNHRLSRAEGIDKILEEHRLDAIAAPSNAPAWLTDWVRGDSRSGGCSATAAVAGYPHITVPAGYVHGLPVGISFFSTAFQEPALLRIAYAFEQATHVRQPPQFLPKARIETSVANPLSAG